MILKQSFIILSAMFLGYAISIGLHLPIPANVVGFILLFAALCFGLVKLHQVDRVSDLIIKYLAVFFVVPSVGVMQYFDLIGKEFLQILLPLFFSIMIGFLTAAKVTEFSIRFSDKRKIKTGKEISDGKTNE